MTLRYVARQRHRPAPAPVLEGNLGYALGALAERLTTQGRYSEAVQVALTAVHLAERNINEAVRRFELFRADLGRELGVAPPGHLSFVLCSAPTEATVTVRSWCAHGCRAKDAHEVR
ncbi:hypothetical protein [Micromonospora sp. NBRC 107095]|uniref:hypothetical protein n=1 Tax=Micromonospora sp. NBRC 107095 TaxID=3032209 RepID=UPI0024A563CC|nr:hypothetical protein [Micromonospora sp. NBRC 107095]GLZ61236.1 hypothetical protein Misp05_48120 [Micromonospora sp. NBRC 107095]